VLFSLISNKYSFSGLVSRVFDSPEACLKGALELAGVLASKSPVAVQSSKLALNFARNHSIETSLEWMAAWNQGHLQSEDLMINAMAMMQKSKPEFKDV
jgi:enoyl-CoA hydratase/carnithine racemase